jgi:quinol monooxygenase YgiN
MYTSIRTYRVGTGEIGDLMHRVDRDFAEAIAQEPGFVAYQAMDTGHRMIMTISVFESREQAEASNELAAEWAADELADFDLTRVGVMAGEIMVSRAGQEMLVPAHA